MFRLTVFECMSGTCMCLSVCFLFLNPPCFLLPQAFVGLLLLRFACFCLSPPFFLATTLAGLVCR